MIHFCELLASSFPPAGPTSELRRFIGADDYRALERLNVFVPADLDGRYPCPNQTLGEHCPRRIIHAPDPVAVCGNPSAQCEEVPLGPDDVRGSQLSTQALLSVLARALAIKGKPSVRSEGRYVFHLGHQDDGARPRSYWFVPNARFSTFRAIAQGLRTRAGARTAVVVIPTAGAIDPSVRADIETAGVEVITLDDHLVLDGDGVRFEAGARRIRVVGPPPRAGANSAPYCVALTEKGKETLAREEYQRTLARAEEFDLLIDTVDRQARGWVRRGEGTGQAALTAHQRDVVVRLVRADGPLAPKQFDPEFQSEKAAFKTFSRIRLKLDPGRQRAWRMFESPREKSRTKTARFKRVRDLHWCVLLPLEDEGNGT